MVVEKLIGGIFGHEMRDAYMIIHYSFLYVYALLGN
jgi:hypothetical protein